MSNVFSSWTSLRRTPYQSFTALFVVMTTFFMVYLFSTLMYLGNQIIYYFETRPQILVFFETEVTDSEASANAVLIGQLDFVEEVTVTTKAKAFENYERENTNEPLLLELLTVDLFPTSLSITANSPEGLDKIREEIDKLEGVDEVDYRQDVIEQFLSWTSAVRNIGMLACVLFVVLFVLVVMVITSMKVAGRRRSINIMSVLGAGHGTIKGTFVRESLWLACLGSLIAFCLVQGLVFYYTPQINEFLGEIKVLPLSGEFLVAQVLAGSGAAMLLAWLAAWLASTRLIRK
jgi:cell division transport system permease protein